MADGRISIPRTEDQMVAPCFTAIYKFRFMVHGSDNTTAPNDHQSILPAGQAGGGGPEHRKFTSILRHCRGNWSHSFPQGKETGDHGGIVRQKDTG